eukprot:3465732-Rhodomonas_salina.1
MKESSIPGLYSDDWNERLLASSQPWFGFCTAACRANSFGKCSRKRKMKSLKVNGRGCEAAVASATVGRKKVEPLSDGASATLYPSTFRNFTPIDSARSGDFKSHAWSKPAA